MSDWIDKTTTAYCKLIELFLVALLGAMVVMVFGNVVLRYGFNSGITFSEEVSRWAFVWMTFLGAVVAIKENGHLGTDILVGRLGPTGKKLCLAVAETLMLVTVGLVLWGSLQQVKISWEVEAPVTGWSMAWLPIAAIIFSVSALLMHLDKLRKLATGQLADDELVAVQENEDLAHIHHDDGDASGDKSNQKAGPR